VVFAPRDANCVGTFDVSTDTFRCVDISATISSIDKFRGAAAVGGQAVFVPHRANCIGVFTTATDAFRCVSITSTVGYNYRFNGAVAINGDVVFAPHTANCVGFSRLQQTPSGAP
jgi:hypothetical protein